MYILTLLGSMLIYPCTVRDSVLFASTGGNGGKRLSGVWRLELMPLGWGARFAPLWPQGSVSILRQKCSRSVSGSPCHALLRLATALVTGSGGKDKWAAASIAPFFAILLRRALVIVVP